MRISDWSSDVCSSDLPAPAPVPVPETPKDLERGDLIALAQRAADAFASGEAVPKAVAEATGRRFELLLPFGCGGPSEARSEEHTSELQSLMRISYAVFCLKTKT